MRTTRYITLIHSMVLLLLLLAACASPQATAPESVAAPRVTQTSMASVERAEFNGIGFSYDPAIAAQVKARLLSGVEYMGTRLPDYIQFSFDDNLQGGIVARQTGIRVFRLRDLEQGDWMVRAAVAAREPMPLINATRILRVQDKLLSFQNGKGERAIVHYAQDTGPLTNEGLFYSYQGVTDDGLYYVSATFPVKAAFLPNTFADGFLGMPTTTPGDPGYMEGYVEAVNHFNRDATERLEQLDAAGYQPNLRTLDAIIRSLFAGEAPEWSTSPEE